jgi:hypothetical protein
MSASFDTVIRAFGNNAGIEVPAEALDHLGGGKRPRVHVVVGGYRFSTTIGSMGGQSLISLSMAHRDASGLSAGQSVQVTVDLDDQPVQIELPPELATALTAAGLTEAFSALAPSRRKEYARQVAEAKTEATRTRRIEKVMADLS